MFSPIETSEKRVARGRLGLMRVKTRTRCLPLTLSLFETSMASGLHHLKYCTTPTVNHWEHNNFFYD